MYQPTLRSIRLNYSILNKKIFDGILPRSTDIEFRIGVMKGALGICMYIRSRDALVVKLRPAFRDRQLFISILAHEMIHVYEFTRHQRMTHGPKFFEWRPLFAQHGIVLAKKYLDD